eukprot:364841-Chlamydomonas_euryale.AAC.11
MSPARDLSERHEVLWQICWRCAGCADKAVLGTDLLAVRRVCRQGCAWTRLFYVWRCVEAHSHSGRLEDERTVTLESHPLPAHHLYRLLQAGHLCPGLLACHLHRLTLQRETTARLIA